MAAGTQDDDEEITGINVTPLVDVMLVLLIIFMVTTTYIAQQAIKVNLPEADTAESQAETKNLDFVLDKSAKLFLNGKEIDFTAIKAIIEQERDKAHGAALQALITADQLTPHGDVIKLIDNVRKNGIKEFAINVRSPTK